MSQKNYYQLLQVSPQATAQEIKAAYRKLAFKYHPDRHKGSTLNEAVFKEINEAYSVLSNPEKRKFYNASIAVNNYQQYKRVVPVTAQSLLQYAIKLRSFVEKSNPFNINQDLVFTKLQTLLSNHHLNILLLENNKQIIQQFLQQLFICMQPLSFYHLVALLPSLQQLASNSEGLQQDVKRFYQHKKREAFWQRYKLLLVFLITLLLCVLMYLL